mgnify:CR=1 FL=1
MSLLRRLEGTGGARPEDVPAEGGAAKPPTEQARPVVIPQRGLDSGPARGSKEWVRELKQRVQDRLIKEFDPKVDVKKTGANASLGRGALAGLKPNRLWPEQLDSQLSRPASAATSRDAR